MVTAFDDIIRDGQGADPVDIDSKSTSSHHVSLQGAVMVTSHDAGIAATLDHVVCDDVSLLHSGNDSRFISANGVPVDSRRPWPRCHERGARPVPGEGAATNFDAGILYLDVDTPIHRARL